MRRFPVAALAALVAVAAALALVAGAVPAGAGGWASASLDPLPAIAPGEAVPVGFTVRAHGTSPVDLGPTQTPDAEAWRGERGVDPVAVGIAIVDPAGDTTFVPARAEGPVGHYVADVAFPSTGTYTWAVHQGIYGIWDLGALDVTADGATASWPAPAGDRSGGSTTPVGQTLSDPIRAARGEAPAEAGPGDVAVGEGEAPRPLAVRLALPAIAVVAVAWLVRDHRASRRVAAPATPVAAGA
jgi:hypothetical protein